jgi:hypothetical protein
MILKHPAALAAILCLILPMAVAAQDVPLPRERPVEVAATPVVPPVPRPRPEAVETPETVPAATPDAPAGSPADASDASESPADAVPLPGTPDGSVPEPTELEPKEPAEPPAPPRVYQIACPAVLNGDAIAEALPPISEASCGLQSPLALSAVTANGRQIPFSNAVTTDCGMATALPGWIGDVDRFLLATENTRIATVNVGTGYMCRNVNNGATGNLSFHAFGDAVDVMGFTLEDGRTIAVETAWPGTVPGGSQLIRFAHDAACTRFTTVLGPEADAQHQDHLHLDLGCHGKTCTARLCQ